jgi:hypothetical protein
LHTGDRLGGAENEVRGQARAPLTIGRWIGEDHAPPGGIEDELEQQLFPPGLIAPNRNPAGADGIDRAPLVVI